MSCAEPVENFNASVQARQPQHWGQGPKQPRLRPNEAHVWRASLDNPRLARPYLDALPLAEIIRAERCGDPRERSRYIAQRVFLRTVLSRYLGTSPDNVRVSENPAGPTRLHSSTLYFTYTQSEDLALLAIAASSGVGMDVERVREDLPFEEMARHFFEPRQQWDVRIIFSKEEKAWKFFDFWTTMEACSQVSKISQPSSPASFMHRNAAPSCLLSLHRLSPADGFLAAVAVSDSHPHLALWDWQ